MSSSVFFKFKSQKEPTRVEFDGTGISVFELKRDIILKSGLGDGTDFDLAIYTEDGAEEYDDDTTIIPRSTTVVARRLPSMKPGAGRAARYVSGKAPVNAKNSSRKEQVAKASTTKAPSAALAQMSNAVTEEERLAAMFQAQSEQWTAQQEELSHQTPIYNGKPGVGKRPANVPDHEPPNGYICYRCGEKGHWIQLCPTNDNPEFDNRPRVKRTTGIPKSFLKTVDKATVLGQAGVDGEEGKVPSGVMVNADGDFVIAQPDKAAWEKFQARTKVSAAAQKVAVQDEKELQDRGLECPMDKRLFNEPMKTPCCEKTYCNDCITNALIESDFVCPGCQAEGVLIDNLKPDDETTAKIKQYHEEKEKEQQKEKEKEADAPKSPAAAKSPSANNQSAKITENNGADSKEVGKASSKSPTTSVKSLAKDPTSPTEISTPNGTVSNPKKRPADQPAENPRVPRAPKAMQQQQQQASHQQQQQQMMQQMMNGMNGGMNPMGMPMMPFAPMPMNGMNAGFMGMPNMGNMNMGNMMNPMMGGGMGGFNGNGNMGYPMGGMSGNMNGNMNGNMSGNMQGNMQGGGWGMNGNGMHGGMGMNGGYNNMNGHMNGGGFNGGYNMNGGGSNMGDFKQFSNQAATEDDAYFRKPVNPHRHQNRQKRVRPSDYREL
ncbi:hypothetical protein MCOR27_004459 [Pyricularia oryzae]|uniref:Uncharacterized protein n=1 Tax=Pyricularia oryzae TaxID=318829 RepID=A0A4P7NCE1_PYROR|nr:hypothetical protein MCOR01_001028 [Pyricularia oryzae]KAH9430456.1 hypothetical protein MCOR02_010157 [Pyricularia oryzae]KAI6255142.1 hypothetical protein MCOR19_008352 [Pyricularia oryzae]KAI6271033.1 hypothetical protein MCOR26_007985 [Pyricularia oryzae]KAI6279322.1 hypothetical protein MCOR34_011233 [Pyricularia oryzae]